MLFPIFVVATLLELFVIVSVGESIGAFNTVMLVVLTAFIGSYLIKQQGFSTLQKAQQSILGGQSPAFEMMEGVVILISGVLLLTPGFITDTVGLLGLLPWSRRYFINHLFIQNAGKIFTQNNIIFTQKIHNTKNKKPNKNPNKNDTIEGEFWEE